MGVDRWVVQLSGTGWRCSQSGLHYLPDDPRNGRHALGRGQQRRAELCSVSLEGPWGYASKTNEVQDGSADGAARDSDPVLVRHHLLLPHALASQGHSVVCPHKQ